MTTVFGQPVADPERDDKSGETTPTPEPRKERVVLVLLRGGIFGGRADVVRTIQA